MSEIPSIEVLEQQEQRLRLAHFDHRAAWFIGSLLYERANTEALPVAIEVYAWGQPLFLVALPGSSNENLEWIARKRRTVLRNAHASLLIGERYKAQDVTMEDLPYLDPRIYTDSGGCFPLLTPGGAVFGAVTVSGLASHDDHALAVWAIEQYLASEK